MLSALLNKTFSFLPYSTSHFGGGFMYISNYTNNVTIIYVTLMCKYFMFQSVNAAYTGGCIACVGYSGNDDIHLVQAAGPDFDILSILVIITDNGFGNLSSNHQLKKNYVIIIIFLLYLKKIFFFFF